MSWAIVAVGAVAAIAGGTGSMMSGNAKKSAVNQAGTAISGPQGRKAFGDVPEAAEYQPVNFDQAQIQDLQGDARAFPATKALVGVENDATTAEALKRARKLVPGYDSMMRTYGAAGSDLLNMRVPFDDALGVVSDRNELSNTLGTPGTMGNITLKDLGMTRMGALEKGGGILKDMVSMAEAVSPTSRYDTVNRFAISPIDRINLEMKQNELIQQSQQNKFNLAATGDPAAMAKIQFLLMQAGQANSPTGSALSSFGGILGGAVGGGGGGKGGMGSLFGGGGGTGGPAPGQVSATS